MAEPTKWSFSLLSCEGLSAATDRTSVKKSEYLYQLTSTLARTADVHTLGALLFAFTQEFWGADYGDLLLLDDDSMELREVSAYGLGEKARSRRPVDLKRERTLATLALQKKQVVITQDSLRSPLIRDKQRHKYPVLQEVWSAPLINGAEGVGVFSLGFLARQEANSDDLQLLQCIGSEAALALERIRSTENLRKNEEYYRTLLALTPDYIYLTDPQGNLLNVNLAGINRVGLSLEQLRQRNIKEFLAGENVQEFIRAETKLRGGQKIRGLAATGRTARGELFDYEINAVPLKNDGRVIEILGIARDVSKRKRAEEALRKAHEELAGRVHDRTTELAKANATLKRELAERRQIEKLIRRAKREWEMTFDDVTELIVFADAQGTILRCNQAVRRALKSSYQDLLGRSVAEVFYGTAHSAAEIFQPSQSESGLTSKRMEAHIPRLNGWFEVTRHPTMSRVGRTRQGVIYTVVDISERKRAEEKLRASHQQLRALSAHLQSVREEERKRVAREIHDELGQRLTSVKMGLARVLRQSLKARDDNSALWQEQLTEMTKRLDDALLSVRRISTSLRPEVLDHFGLIAALEWQAQEFQCQTDIRCKFTSTSEKVDLGQDSCTAIFRILQETLTNVARHAEATRVNIRVQETVKALVLKVADNGKGITEDAVVDIHSLGLLGLRERSLLLGGEFCIKGVQGKGTTVTVRIPLERSAQNK